MELVGRRAPDPRFTAIRVDANFFDVSIGEVERVAADELMSLALNGDELTIAIPHSVRQELDRPQTPSDTQRRAGMLPYTLDTGGGNVLRMQQVQRIMRGNAKVGAHEADAAHLYDSALWSAGYFVTLDGRIHRKSRELSAVIKDLWIVRPSELLEIYREFCVRYPRSVLFPDQT